MRWWKGRIQQSSSTLSYNCHALKTRANILRRDKAFKKEFGKRFDLMQTNSFKEFEYKPKQSKYFS